MYSISSGKNILKKNAEQIVFSLCKYKSLIATSKRDHNHSQGEIQFHFKLIANETNKINMELLRVYDYLEEKQESDVKNIVEEFASLFNEMNELFRKANNNAKGETRKMNNSLLCSNCKNFVEEARIAMIKENIGITVCSIEEIFGINGSKGDELKGERKIQQYLKIDDFEEKQKVHISNLQIHIMSLMKIVEKEYESKVIKILGKENEFFKKNELELKEQSTIVKQNEKQYRETRQYYEKFKQNFMELIKKPIEQTVMKLLNFIIEQKKLKIHENFVSVQTQVIVSLIQTLIAPENQMQQFLQAKIMEQESEIKRVWALKKERDQDVLKYLEAEFQIRKQINKIQQDKTILQEKLRQSQEKINVIQKKSHLQLGIKCKEMSRLEKQIFDLKQKLAEKDKSIKNQTISSKKSIGSLIRVANRSLSRKQIEKDVKQNLQSKHIIDFTIEDEEKQNSKNHRLNHHKKKLSKHINTIRSIKNSDGQKSQSKATVHFKDSTLISQFASKSKINDQIKSPHLHIHHQFHIIIQPKVSYSQSVKQLNNKIFASKKNKKIRVLQTERKENKENIGKIQKNSSKVPKQLLQKTFSRTMTSLNKGMMKKDEQQLDVRDKEDNTKVGSSPKMQKQRYITQTFEMRKENKDKITNLGRRFKSRNFNMKTNSQKQENNPQYLLPEIKFKFIELFGGENYASEFENCTGIWPYLNTVDKLVVDYENSNFANRVQQYFTQLYENSEPKLAEYLSFLKRPASYFEAKKKNQQQQYEKPQNSSISNIKIQFIQLARFHKLVHKNCSHIMEFLQEIGFFIS